MFGAMAEELMPVSQAVERFTGRRISPSTGWRWTRRGVRGIVLESVVVGDRVMTTVAAVRRFFMATSRARGAKLIDGNRDCSMGNPQHRRCGPPESMPSDCRKESQEDRESEFPQRGGRNDQSK